MTRGFKYAFFVAALTMAFGGVRDARAQERQTKEPELKHRPSKPTEARTQEPPEEDESLAPKEYSFNPLQAEKEIRIGNFYFKKGNHKAAAQRFSEATKWDPNSAAAYLRLGESEDKLKDRRAAREAYAKYLELAPDGKEAASIKRKLSGK